MNALEAQPPVDESDRLQVLRNTDAAIGIAKSSSLYDFVTYGGRALEATRTSWAKSSADVQRLHRG